MKPFQRYRHPLADPVPYREISEETRARVEEKAGEYIAMLTAHDALIRRVFEKLAFGRLRDARELEQSVDELIVGFGKVVWEFERLGEHARYMQKTPYQSPPDPDRVRTPADIERRLRAARSALTGSPHNDELAGFHAAFDPDRTPVYPPQPFDPEGDTKVGRRRRH